MLKRKKIRKLKIPPKAKNDINNNKGIFSSRIKIVLFFITIASY